VLLKVFIPRFLGDGIDALRDLAAAGPEVLDGERLRHQVLLAALLITGSATATAVVRTASRLLLLGNSRRVVHDLRDRLFRRLLVLPPSWYLDHPTGALLSRVVNDARHVQALAGPVLLYLAETACLYALGLAFMLRIDPFLTVCGMAPFPLFLWLTRRLAARIQRGSRAAQERLAAVGAHVSESLGGQLVLRTLGLEEYDRRRFAATARACRDQNLALARDRANLGATMLALAALTTLTVLVVGGPRVVSGRLSLGGFAAMILYLNMVAAPTAVLGFVISSLRRGAAALERLGEILDAPVALGDPADPLPPPEGPGRITLRGLTVRLASAGRERTVLEDLHLDVPGGTTLGVVGPTGAGKSVLLRTLARLVEIEPGRVFVDGTDLTRLRLADARSLCGLVPQDGFLFSATLAENIAFGRPDAGREELRAAAAAAGLDPDLELLPEGLHTLVGERGVRLSGGQRQRVALARALLRRPRILLLDDTLSAVDTATAEAILRALQPWMAGRTTVLVAHRLATVRSARHIVVLDRGRLVEQGRHEELVAAGGLYARLWEQQQRDAGGPARGGET